MLKQKSNLILTVTFVIALVLLLFMLLDKMPFSSLPLTTDETPVSLNEHGASDIVIGLSDEAAPISDLSLCADPSFNQSHILFYNENVTPLIERRLSLSQDTIGHYGLFQIKATTVAVFYIEAISDQNAKTLAHLIRCYADYYPIAIIGNLSIKSTTLLQTVVDLKSVYVKNYTILSANLNLTSTQENILIGKASPTLKTLDLNKPMVAITYDDGPSPFTQKVLDAIEKHNAKATFYTLGAQVELYPQTVTAIFKSGCEIGNHTNLHEVFSSNTQSIIRKSIDETNRKLTKILGIGAATVRPPTGALHDRNGKHITIGYPIVLWSVDTRDFENPSDESALLASIMSSITDGAIVLMHDTQENTANSTDAIFGSILSEGFQAVTVSELLEFRCGGASVDAVYKGNASS